MTGEAAGWREEGAEEVWKDIRKALPNIKKREHQIQGRTEKPIDQAERDRERK